MPEVERMPPQQDWHPCGSCPNYDVVYGPCFSLWDTCYYGECSPTDYDTPRGEDFPSGCEPPEEDE